MAIFRSPLKTKFINLNMLITLKIRKIKSNGSIFTTPEFIIHLNMWLKSKISKKKFWVLERKFRPNLKNHKKILKIKNFFKINSNFQVYNI